MNSCGAVADAVIAVVKTVASTIVTAAGVDAAEFTAAAVAPAAVVATEMAASSGRQEAVK